MTGREQVRTVNPTICATSSRIEASAKPPELDATYNKKLMYSRKITNTNLLTYLFTPWCRILFQKLIVTELVKKYPFFVEHEGSLPCSHKPAIGPYPKPAESSSSHRFLSPNGPAYCYKSTYA
jgi:hypothetical protein